MNISEIEEIFLDINMNTFLDLHENLKNDYEMFGYLNESTSTRFISMIMENILLNENSYDSSSDEEGNNKL